MRRNSGATGSSTQRRSPGTSRRHSGDPAAPRTRPADRILVAMRAGRALPLVHRVSAVIHASECRVDGMGTDFVGNPLSVPGFSAQDRFGSAPASTAANPAEPTPGGGGA